MLPSSVAVPWPISGAPVPGPSVSHNVPYESTSANERTPSWFGPLKMYLSVLPSPAMSWATQTPVSGSPAAVAEAATTAETTASMRRALHIMMLLRIDDCGSSARALRANETGGQTYVSVLTDRSRLRIRFARRRAAAKRLRSLVDRDASPGADDGASRYR